jgi:hypothetical protein
VAELQGGQLWCGAEGGRRSSNQVGGDWGPATAEKFQAKKSWAPRASANSFIRLEADLQSDHKRRHPRHKHFLWCLTSLSPSSKSTPWLVRKPAVKMASDEIVWQIINQQFCSFKLKYDQYSILALHGLL